MIRAHSDSARAIEHRGQRERVDADVGARAAVEQTERGPRDLLPDRQALGGFYHRLAFAVHGVAGQARNRGTIGQRRIEQLPRALSVQRLHHGGDGAFEVHAVAAQAIVPQEALPVVLRGGEDTRIRRGVRAGTPLRELLAMAAAAFVRHGKDVRGLQVDLLRNLAGEVRGHAAQVGLGGAGVAIRAVQFAMGGAAPRIEVGADLVATRAALCRERTGNRDRLWESAQCGAQQRKRRSPRAGRVFMIGTSCRSTSSPCSPRCDRHSP